MLFAVVRLQRFAYAGLPNKPNIRTEIEMYFSVPSVPLWLNISVYLRSLADNFALAFCQ